MTDKQKLLFIVNLMVLVLIIIPLIITIAYSLPTIDDFQMIGGTDYSGDYPIFQRSVLIANHYYMTWSGLWPYMFLESLISPLNYFHLSGMGYGFEMMLFFLAFCFLCWRLIKELCFKYLNQVTHHFVFSFFLLFLFSFFNSIGINGFREVFLWFVGSSYLWAMLFGISTILFALKLADDLWITRLILACVFGVMTGFFFQAAVLPGMVTFLVAVYNLTMHKTKRTLFPFLSILLGGGIAILSPGNYVRHEWFDSTLNVKKALLDSLVTIFKDAILYQFLQPWFIILLIVSIYLGYRSCSDIQPKNFFLVCSVSFITLYINAFPQALGYASAGSTPRYRVILLFTLNAGTIISSVLLGSILRQLRLTLQKIIIGVLAMGLFLCCGRWLYKKHHLPIVNIYAHLKETREISLTWKAFFLNCETTDGKSLEYVMDESAQFSDFINTPPVTDDYENAYNQKVAAYYGLEKIRIVFSKQPLGDS